MIRSEVGRPEGLWLTTGRPTSERITPGEILSEWPEITTPVWFWPKFLENHTPVNLQKFSHGLLHDINLEIQIAGQSMEKEESDQVWDAVRKDRARGGYPWTHLSHPQDEEVWLNPEKLPDNIGRQAEH